MKHPMHDLDFRSQRWFRLQILCNQ